MNEVTRVEGDIAVEDPVEVPPAAPPPSAPAVAAVPRWRLPVMLAVPLIIVALGLYFWLTGGKTVSTDNAEVGAHVVSIAPEVGGRIAEVAVTENQQVRKGDLLFRIDPAPYRIALMQADAAIGTARLGIDQMSGDYSSKLADVQEKASDVQLAQENFRRQKELLARGFATRATYDAAQAALSAARASQSSAAATAQSARALLSTEASGGHPQVLSAMAMREKAALDLARTELRAPISGRVTQSDRLEPGNMAVAALPMVTIVDSSKMWIEANFKETQLARIRPGQRAEVTIDAIPGRTFKAHVGGIGAATGSESSILPAQNASGNWVKVTQRVQVRFVLDEDPGQPLSAGWSAHVTVHVAD